MLDISWVDAWLQLPSTYIHVHICVPMGPSVFAYESCDCPYTVVLKECKHLAKPVVTGRAYQLCQTRHQTEQLITVQASALNRLERFGTRHARNPI